MNSREKILTAVRASQVPEVTLPDLEGDWLSFADPRHQFLEALTAVGGQARVLAGPSELAAACEQVEPLRVATRVLSMVPEIPSAGGEWLQMTDPHELEPLQCCVVPGELAVAENAAVWLTDQTLPQRAALFIAQHLVLVVPTDRLVQNMHEAYARIPLDQVQFGIFVSGPSKTADIEQANGQRPQTIVTCARPQRGSVSYGALREKLGDGAPALLLFGTAWGLAPECMSAADIILDPVRGIGPYNHLSVRSATAIILDRLCGEFN